MAKFKTASAVKNSQVFVEVLACEIFGNFTPEVKKKKKTVILSTEVSFETQKFKQYSKVRTPYTNQERTVFSSSRFSKFFFSKLALTTANTLLQISAYLKGFKKNIQLR